MPELSVILITKNEAANIRDCLGSVAWADEIIVVDSGSTDDTVAICKEFGAQVYTHDWPGFGVQKNRALGYASKDWVLSLDADERVTPELRADIERALNPDNPLGRHSGAGRNPAKKYMPRSGQNHDVVPLARGIVNHLDTGLRRYDVVFANGLSGLKADKECDAYLVPRLSNYCGRFMRHSGWYPDLLPRLFKRGQAHFSDDLVHERLIVEGETGELHGMLLHYAFDDMEEVLHKVNQYSTAGAQMMQRRGRQASLTGAVLRGLWSFVRTYILRGGFLDGREGFMLSVSNAEGTYYRYLKLMLLNRKS